MSDDYIHIRINRKALIATVVSLLAHALALFFLSRQDLFSQHQPVEARQQAIVVRLNSPTPPKAEATVPADIQRPAIAPALHQAKKQKADPISDPRTDSSAVIASQRVETPLISPPAQAVPAPAKPVALDPSQFADMASYLNAVRERRRLSGDAGSINEEAIARERGRSAEEARMANLRRNLQPSGTNGIFQILSMDARTATFAFRGWKNEFSYSHREVYQVDADHDGEITRAVVRKMIEIIRRYYDGDFNWDSFRLGRVVVLSARRQDNSGLEDFMMQEFFGTNGVTVR